MEPSPKYILLHMFVRNHAGWLSLKDLYRTLATCKNINALRYNSAFVFRLCHDYLSPKQPYQRVAMKIIKKAVRDYENKNRIQTESERKYLNQVKARLALIRNGIKNSSGKHQMMGWHIIQNGGAKFNVEIVFTHSPKSTCITTSSRPCEAVYTIPIERFLSRGLSTEDLMTKVIFKGGCHIGRKQEHKANGRVRFYVLDKDKNTIYKQTANVNSQEINKSTYRHVDYSRKEFTYDPSEHKAQPKYLAINIRGKAKNGPKFGWCGTRFSDAEVRCYIKEDMTVRMNTQQMLASAKDEKVKGDAKELAQDEADKSLFLELDQISEGESDSGESDYSYDSYDYNRSYGSYDDDSLDHGYGGDNEIADHAFEVIYGYSRNEWYSN